MKDRIRQLMEAQHMNQQTFASFTGIGTASLSSIFTGRTRPTLNHVDAILEKFPNVNPMWLIKGTGGMLLSSDAKTSSDANSSSGSSEGSENNVSSPENASLVNSDNMSQDANLFGNTAPLNSHIVSGQNNNAKNATSFHFEAEKNAVLPQRKITEIRVFYDDQTWESFVPKKEK